MSRKHRKYAGDDAHFEGLDRVLARVRRRTVEEVEEENARFIEEAQAHALAMPSSEGEDSEALMQQVGDAAFGDDVKWDDWVDAGNCAIEV